MIHPDELKQNAIFRQPEGWTLVLIYIGTLLLPYFANIGACFYLLALLPFCYWCWSQWRKAAFSDPWFWGLLAYAIAAVFLAWLTPGPLLQLSPVIYLLLAYAFYIVAAVPLLLSLRAARASGREPDRALWWMLGYTALALLLTPLTASPAFNLYGLFTRFVFYFLVYALVNGICDLPERRRLLCWIIVIGGWSCAWLGIWQYLGPSICSRFGQHFGSWSLWGVEMFVTCNNFHIQAGRLPFEEFPGMVPYFFIDLIMLPQMDGRARSILMGPTIFGVWLALLLPLIVHATVAARRRWLKIVAAVNLAATICVLILTFTRNAWVSGFLALALYIALTRSWRLAGVLSGLGAISLAALTAARPGIWQLFVERIYSIPSLSYESNAERVYMWKQSLVQIAAHPLAGVGNYGFRLAVPELWNRGWPHAHNQWLHMLLENGFPLTILITVIWALLTVRGWRRLQVMEPGSEERGWQIAIFCGMIAFYLLGFVDYTAYEPRCYHIFWLYLALL